MPRAQPFSTVVVMSLTAIAFAAIGALGLAVGTHLQHRAVREDPVPADPPAGTRRAGALAIRALARPVWLLGMGVIVLATALNVVALGLAPIALVQPVGSLALVCAALISALALRVPLSRGLLAGISLAVVSVAVFVGVSARFSFETRATDSSVSPVSWLLFGLCLLGLLAIRLRTGHIARVTCAGVIFGGVASAVHIVAVEVISRLGADAPGAVNEAAHGIDAHPVSTIGLCVLVALLAAASGIGMWLVQTAYASGPPETVLAGLTVIDPLTAIAVGAVLLGEYDRIPLPGILALALSGVAALLGILLIVRHHPGLARAERPRGRVDPSSRGSRFRDPPETVTADGAAATNRRS